VQVGLVVQTQSKSNICRYGSSGHTVRILMRPLVAMGMKGQFDYQMMLITELILPTEQEEQNQNVTNNWSMNQKRSSLLKQLRYKTLKVYKDLYPRL
jgi:hypothetical protein